MKYLIKVPETVSVLYCPNRQVLFIKKNKKTSLMHLKLKLLFLNKKTIYVTNQKFFCFSNIEKKNLKSLRGVTFYQLLKTFIKFRIIFLKN